MTIYLAMLIMHSNIMAGGSSSMGRPTAQKSNQEFVNSLRDNFEASIEGASYSEVNGHDSAQPTPKPDSNNWISWSKDGKTLEVPALDFTGSSLQEEREAYDITVKLFYLPGVSHTRREAQTREAIELVLKELHMPSVDLLIASFPGIYFDEKGEDCPDKIKSRGPIEAEPEPLGTQIETYKILEKLHDEGLVKRLGVSEFGADRLEPFLRQTRILPSVDQINLRDCCSVPEPLLSLAKGKEIELLVHNDCTNILPRGTVRDLLGPGEKGVGILAADANKAGVKRKERDGEESGEGLKGEVEPQWVVKYTAVVKDRGVVENKGYFAVAEVEG